MAVLRSVEERDSKGNTIRVNPTIVYEQSREVRTVIGKHDYRMDPNPDFHPPITAQAQNGKILFFLGVPFNASSRKNAKEVSLADVQKIAPKVVAELKAHPMKVREARPTVYEVKLATIGDVQTTAVEEVPSADGQSVTITAVEPDINPHLRARRVSAAEEADVTL